MKHEHLIVLSLVAIDIPLGLVCGMKFGFGSLMALVVFAIVVAAVGAETPDPGGIIAVIASLASVWTTFAIVGAIAAGSL